jgi:protein SCO1
MKMSWRLASRLSVLTLALLVVLVVALWGLRNSSAATPSSGQVSSGLAYGVALGNTAAPNFTLKDQFGKTISLSQFRGEPVVLTFFYTHCPDACPLTAEKLHSVQGQLGSASSKVVMIAVSVDPKGDTVASVLNFDKVHKLTGSWHYLLGTEKQLAPVWNNYSVYSAPTTGTGVSHTTALFVIDQQGLERVFFGDDFTPPQLTNDLQTLLKK